METQKPNRYWQPLAATGAWLTSVRVASHLVWLSVAVCNIALEVGYEPLKYIDFNLVVLISSQIRVFAKNFAERFSVCDAETTCTDQLDCR